MKDYDVAVVGGGPAGLAGAIEAKKHGANSVLIIERDRELGGILNQCIHNGFGLHEFNEELTGPEYAQRFIQKVHKMDIDIMLNTMVPFVGIILAIIVFVLGHLVNCAFQTLGAGVNALRLNYVEFFGQFYIGGKHKFEAFKASRKFTKFND